MKRLILGSVLVIAAGAILLELMRADTGYVLIAIGSTTVEMSFWVAVALLLTAMLTVALVTTFFKRLFRLFSRGLGFSAKRGRKVEQRTASGLISFIEGNWRTAKKDLLKAARHAQNPLVHYLAAARCSYELGDREETQQLLHQAEKIAPQNELAVALSQARIQLLDKKYEQCLATLKRARILAPEHPTILDLLRQVYWHLRDWVSLQALLPELRKQKLYHPDEQALLEQNVYMALLSTAGKQAEKSDKQAAEKILSETWSSLPKAVRGEDPVIGLYSKLLVDAGLPDSAEKLLRQHLANHWNNELVTLYGLVAGAHPKEQLIVAEQWLRERPGDADLLLTLGRISLRNQLWGKAREYFESSLKLRPRAEAYAELARLLAYLGEHEKSTQLYQQGLLDTTHGLPALPLPERKAMVTSDE